MAAPTLHGGAGDRRDWQQSTAVVCLDPPRNRKEKFEMTLEALEKAFWQLEGDARMQEFVASQIEAVRADLDQMQRQPGDSDDNV